MNLLMIAALLAACGAVKLDRTYLPPSSAKTAGGSPGSLQAPVTRTSEQEAQNTFPSGSYTNDFGGVVVDAALGTRSSEGQSGLGGPRPSYGSTDSKVGDAAFRGSAGFRETHSGAPSGQTTHGQSTAQFDTHASHFTSNAQNLQGFSRPDNQIAPGQFENKSERPQAAKDRSSNILALTNDVNIDGYSYGFETDNGITVGENGVAVNGIQAEGGYSYQGDDGQVYKVTYVADEGGYRPQGAHLPTPPPIPEEILKSLERNAKEEAAGIVDDGSYDAQKYNTDSDYTRDNGVNVPYNSGQMSQFGKQPATGSVNQNIQSFGTTGSVQYGSMAFIGQSNHGNPGSEQFSDASNIQNSFGQTNQATKPGQFGISGSQSTSTVNNKPGSTQIGSGHQSTHTFGQSSHEFDSNVAAAQNENSGSHIGHSSQSLNGHESSATGHTFGHTGNQISSLGQTQGSFGSQTQFGPQSSTQFENKTPESGSQQNKHGLNTQFSSKPSKPSFGQDAGTSASSHSNPQFGSSFKPQGSEAFSGASLNQEQDAQDFGKPSPQTFTGENFNRPSAGSFNYRKPSFGQNQMNFGSSTTNGFNRFPQASGQTGALNEYLPPLNKGQPQPNKPESSASGFTSNIGTLESNSNGREKVQKDKIPDFVAPNRPKPGFASASASTFGQPAYQPQPARPLNAIDTQLQLKPDQSTQQTNQFNQQTNQVLAQNPAQSQQSNSQLSSSFAAQSVSGFGSKPTAIPDTELTTPLEPNQTPTSQGSQFPSQTTSSFSSFSSSPTSNSQAQAQFGIQGNSAYGQQSTGDTLAPSVPTSSTNIKLPFGAASTQSAFQSVGEAPGNSNGKPQYPQNSYAQIQQKQPSFSQSFDNSYYNNKPSQAFGIPAQLQGSRFPSSSSYQSNGVASQNQFFNQQNSQSSDKFPGSFAPVGPTTATKFTQSQGYSGITQAAISPFPSASSTPSSHSDHNQVETKPSINQQSTFGNQAQKPQYPAQPIISQFPSGVQSSNSLPGSKLQSQLEQSKTPSDDSSQLQTTQFQQSEMTQTNKFANKPGFSQQPTLGNQAQKTEIPRPITGRFPSDLDFGKIQSSGSQIQTSLGHSGTPSMGVSSQQQNTETQPYQGAIYEYNKPAEVLPESTQDSSSSQTIQSGIKSETKPFGQSQSNQIPIQQNLKPFSQVGETGSKLDSQSNKPFGGSSAFQFGQHSQTSQVSQNSQPTGIQFGSQPANPFNAPSSTNIQFGQTAQLVQPSKPFASSSSIQFGQSATITPDSSSLLQNNQGSQVAQPFEPFGSANKGSSFGSKPQFGSQTSQYSQTTFGNPQSSQPERGSQSQFSSQTFQNTAFSQGNGYYYPSPEFSEGSQNPFSQNSQFGRPQPGSIHNTQSGNPQPLDQQPLFNTGSKPQFAGLAGHNNQKTQATFGQKAPNSPFSQPQFGAPTASSQASASGQATASATASTSPQEYKPFGSQNKNQFSQTPDQSGQGTQFAAQKPFGTQESDVPSSKPSSQVLEASKPLFKSACCQASKDSTPAQSTDRPGSVFQGTQNFNAQSFAGKGEEFGGPRDPPKFDDQTGYHY